MIVAQKEAIRTPFCTVRPNSCKLGLLKVSSSQGSGQWGYRYTR